MMKILIKKDEQNDKMKKILEQNSNEFISIAKKKSKSIQLLEEIKA